MGRLVDLSGYTTVTIGNIDKDLVPMGEYVRNWCTCKYKGRIGCPNYGKKDLCPPKLKYDGGLLDGYKFVYLVLTSFDIDPFSGEFAKIWKSRKGKSPTNRQAKCLLYWQDGVKSIIAKYIESMNIGESDLFLGCGSGMLNRPSMEAVGINVYKLLRNIGVIFDHNMKDLKYVTFVCLIATHEPLRGSGLF